MKTILGISVLLATLFFAIGCGLWTKEDKQKDTSSAAAISAGIREENAAALEAQETKSSKALQPIAIKINLPAFELSLLNQGNIVKTYLIGIGKDRFPTIIGTRNASKIILNPNWVVPASPWVKTKRGVRPGQRIAAGDKRNPLGKIKVPLGGGYLIHEAAKRSDLGHAVSHGCIRMTRNDLYNLLARIIRMHGLEARSQQIEAAKRASRMVTVSLKPEVPVTIEYETLVIAGGLLTIYPDIYRRRTSTVQKLRALLLKAGIKETSTHDRLLRRLISLARGKKKLSVKMTEINRGQIAENRLVR